VAVICLYYTSYVQYGTIGASFDGLKYLSGRLLRANKGCGCRSEVLRVRGKASRYTQSTRWRRTADAGE